MRYLLLLLALLMAAFGEPALAQLNPPAPPLDQTCTGGQGLTAIHPGQPGVCGAFTATATINTGGPQALAGYLLSGNVLSPLTTAAGIKVSGGQLSPDLTVVAPLASPTFTGTPLAPTAAVSTNTTQVATTAYVKSQGYLTGITGPQVTTALGYTPLNSTTIVSAASPLTGGGQLLSGLALGLTGPSNLTTFAANVIPKGASNSPFTASSITDSGGGVIIGSPTGGAMGANTLNVAGPVFVNGIAVGTGAGSGTVTGPASSINGFVPQWNGTTGAALSGGLPVGTSGTSTIVETTPAGTVSPMVLAAATTSTLGAIKVDGTTIMADASGLAHAIGTPAGTKDQIQANNGVGGFEAFTANGSCTISAPTGAVTCNLGGTPLQTYSVQGSTTKLQTATGAAPISGDYPIYDINGNLTDGGTITSNKITTALGYTPLNPANNLGDVTSAMTGRINLGLGTIAVQNAASVNFTGGTSNGVAVTGLSNPVNPSDATNKSYVDGAVTGALSHTQVAVATAAILPNTPAYNNGSSGVGATLTGVTSTTLTVDGQSVTNGQRVLVKNEATAANNGIYVATIGGSPWVLTRATDFNTATTGNLALGAYVFVSAGTVNCSPTCTIWQLGAPTPSSIVIGTTALTFNMIGAAGSTSVALSATTPNLVVGGSPGNVLTIASTIALDTQAGNSVFAIPSTDAQKTTYRTNTVAEADTIASPLTGGFGSGFGLRYYNVTAGQSITPGAGTLNGLAALTLGANQGLSLFSDGTNYRALLGMPTPATEDGTTLLSNDMTYKQVGTAQIASAAVTTPKIAASVSLTTPTIAGGTLSGTLAGTPTFSGVPIFSGLSSVTCTNGAAFDSGGHLGTVACPSAGGTLNTTDGTHSVGSTTQQTFGNCFLIGGSAGLATVSLTQPVTSQTAGNYTFATTDACSTVEVTGGFTYTYPLATLTSGFGLRVHNIGTTTNATISATGGNFTGLGIANAASFTLAPGQYADIITPTGGSVALVQMPPAIGAGNGLSGMMTGQLAIAGTSNTITSGINTGVTGSGTFVPQTSAGLLSATILPVATTAAAGILQPDVNQFTVTAGVLDVRTQGVVDSTENNITAIGSISGGPTSAYSLTKSLSEVLTVPSGTCVRLPSFMLTPGGRERIVSYGANPLCVFPASGQAISVGGTANAINAAVMVPAGSVVDYESSTASKVYQVSLFTAPPNAPLVCTINVTGNASIQTAINTVGAGTAGNPNVICLHGTFTAQTFTTKNYLTFQGDGVASTVIDGNNAIASPGEMTDGLSDLTVGVVFDSIKFQKYGGTANCVENVSDGASTMNMWDGWVLQNSEITLSKCEGVVLQGSATVRNSLITANTHDGILVNTANASSNLAGQTISGNEISSNNTGTYTCGTNVSNVKLNGLYSSTQQNFSLIKNNYVHDMGNACNGIWADGYVINMSVQSNTLVNNGFGIVVEISPGSNLTGAKAPTDIGHNVINASATTAIQLQASGGANVHDNNVSVPSGAHAIFSGIDSRLVGMTSDSQDESNVSFNSNTVTFLANGGEGYGAWSQCPVGQSSHGTDSTGHTTTPCTTPFATGRLSGTFPNHFHVSSAIGDVHFAWVTATDAGLTYFTSTDFATYKTRWGQDTNSTIAVDNASVTGCTTAWTQAQPNVCPTGSGW